MKFLHYLFGIVILVVVLIHAPNTFASDFSLKCNETKCTPASITSFFDGQVLWYPTYTTSNIVTITNSSKESQYVGHRAYNIRTSPEADIAQVLDLEIIRKSVNKMVWKSTLREYYDTSEAVLGSLGPKKTDSFEYIVTMNKNAGNEYQGQYTQFDMLFGYFVPTITPTPTNTLTPSPIPLSSSPTQEGEVQGASDSQVSKPIIFPPVLQQLVSTVQKILVPSRNGEAPVFAMNTRQQSNNSHVLGTQTSPNIAKTVLLILLTGSLGGLVYLTHLMGKRK